MKSGSVSSGSNHQYKTSALQNCLQQRGVEGKRIGKDGVEASTWFSGAGECRQIQTGNINSASQSFIIIIRMFNSNRSLKSKNPILGNPVVTLCPSPFARHYRSFEAGVLLQHTYNHVTTPSKASLHHIVCWAALREVWRGAAFQLFKALKGVWWSHLVSWSIETSFLFVQKNY